MFKFPSKTRSMKKIWLFFFMLSAGTVFAQDILLKGGMVYVKGKPCLKVSSLSLNSTEFSDLEGNYSVIAKTYSVPDECLPVFYTKVIISGPDTAVAFKAVGTYSKKTIAALLVRSGLADPQTCKFNLKNLKRFRLLFDESEDSQK